jgi:hypothetical protein
MFGRPAPEWIMEALLRMPMGLKYSRLVRVSDPSKRKTLALAVLCDRRRFTLVDAGKADQDQFRPTV